MADVPAGPTFPIPEPPPPPPPPEPPPPAPPPWKSGGWNDPRGIAGKDGPTNIRWGPVIVFGFLFLSIAGVVAYLLSAPSAPPRPDLVIIPLYRYVNPTMPVNAWAERDADRITACFPPEEGQARTKQKGLSDDKPAEFLNILKELEKQSPDRPFILMISGTAVAEGDVVHVLLSEGDVLKPGTASVPLQAILEALEKCPAKQKLLALDIARPLAWPIIGPFRTDAGTALHKLLTESKLPCPVLVSASPGEYSHAMGPEGASAFAFYLADGMRGNADGSDGDKSGRDKKISMKELSLFVSARVNRWVKRVYDESQTPRLYAQGHEGAGFTVSIPSLIPEASIGKTNGTMKANWKLRDDRAQELQARFPLVLAVANAGMLRADTLAAAGMTGMAQDEAAKAENRLEEVWRKQAKPIPTLAPYPCLAGLPDGLAKGTPAADEAAAKLRRAVETYYSKATTKTPFPKQDERVKARENLKEAADGALVAAAKVLVKRVMDAGEITESATKDIATMLADLLRSDANVGEVILFRKAAEQPEETPLLSNESLPALLKAEDAFARAVTASRGAFLNVGDGLMNLDLARATAEAAIFKAASSAETKTAIATLKKVATDCDAVEKRAAAVMALRLTVEKSLLLLVNSSSLAGEDANWLDEWKILAQELRPVAGTAPVDLAFTITPLNESTDNITAANARVKRAYDRLWDKAVKVVETAEKLKKVEAITPADVRPLRLILNTPVLSETNRRIVFDCLLLFEDKLHELVRKTQDEPEDGAEKGYPRTAPGSPIVDTNATRTSQMKTTVTLTLLNIAGVTVPSLSTTAEDPAVAMKAVETLRGIWLKDVIQQMESLTKKGELAKAELLCRVIPPSAAVLLKPEQSSTSAPADDARKLNTVKAAEWLEKHYGQYRLLRPQAKDFYAEKAREAATVRNELAK